MVENVTKRRRVRSLALLGVLLGLCIAAAVVWLLYYHNRTYLSDAVANVDGTIETGSNAVELALKGLSESAPADIIQGAPGETTRVGLVFVGLTEEADTNHAVLELIKQNGLKASFALSAAEALDNEDFLTDMLAEGNDLLSNGAAGESNLHTRTTQEMVSTMLKSREAIATAANESVPLLYCSSTALTGDVLRAASVSGYEAVVQAADSHVLSESSFEAAADAESFVAGLQGDAVVVVNLRGVAEEIQNEDAVTAEKPAIDKQPELDDTKQPEDEKADILTQVNWLVQALKAQDMKTEYVSRFSRVKGLDVLRSEAEIADAEMAPIYRSCLTNQKQAGVAIRTLPSADGMDAALEILTQQNITATYFATAEEAAARSEELARLEAAGCSVGLYLPAEQLKGLSRMAVFDKLYDALCTFESASGLVLADAQTDAEAMTSLRAAARLLNTKIVMPENPEQMQAGSLYLLDTLDTEHLSALKQQAEQAGLQLTDLATVIQKSGTLPTLTPQELSALRKQNDHKLATVENMVYTSERSEGFSQYGMGGKAAAVSTIAKVKDPDAKGMFFLTLNELMNCPDAVEKTLKEGNRIGIAYKPSDDYPQTFDAMMNYLNAWEKYAKWRYNSESDVVLMPSETASDAVSEAISASGCKLVKIVLGKVLNGVVTVPETTAVPLNYFDDVTFIGDSLTLGMESYKTGLPNAKFCAYKGIGPNAIATDMTCMREDGTSEKPLEKLAAQNPKAVYILLGTNVLGTDGDYNGFLAYYRLMLDAVAQAVPGATIYIQSITPVQLSASVEHPGLNQTRLKQVNQELALIAQEKNCYYLDLWDVLADENGNLKADIAQEDGYHLKSAGYTLWVDYLRTHTVG